MRKPMSQKRDMGHPVSGMSLGVLGYEVDASYEAGGDGLDFVEVLYLEAVAVFFYEGVVVVRGERGPGVEGGVVDADLDVVLAGFEQMGYVEAVGWVPECAGALAVEEDDGGFVDGWIVVGVHSGAG